MNVVSHLVQRMLRLPPPVTRELTVERDLRVPMRDGAVLLADRWVPKSGAAGLPTALIRIPYGRAGMIAAQMARPLAERGFQVLIQSTRGTFGSGGAFDPMRGEREDGLDTVDWVLEQPWFGGAIVLFGGSYVGHVQWTMADRLPPEVKAMIPFVSESAFTLDFLRQDGFSLEVTFTWGVQVNGQERRWAMPRQLLQVGKHRRALYTLPLNQADVAAIGHHSDYFQNVLAHDADSPFWAVLDNSSRVGEIGVPVSSIGGWYDVFLPGTTPRPPVAAGRRSTGSPHDRAVGTHLAGRPRDDGARRGVRLRARPRPRRTTGRPGPGAAVRHGRGHVARLFVVAAAGIPGAALPPATGWLPGR
jgi:predicted acyl esterase